MFREIQPHLFRAVVVSPLRLDYDQLEMWRQLGVWMYPMRTIGISLITVISTVPLMIGFFRDAEDDEDFRDCFSVLLYLAIPAETDVLGGR